MSENYVHCSWDILEPDSLVPRIPKTRIDGPNVKEDDTVPRICVSDTVQRALMAMPGTGKIIKNMQKYKVPVIIHAYIPSIFRISWMTGLEIVILFRQMMQEYFLQAGTENQSVHMSIQILKVLPGI